MNRFEGICKGCQEQLSDTSTLSNGFIVCQSCGTVTDVHIEPSAEWRCYPQFDGGRDLSMVRCGSAVEANESHTTGIEGSDFKLKRLHRWSTMTTRDRTLYDAHREFETICRKYALIPSILTTMDQLFTLLYDTMMNSNRGSKRSTLKTGLKCACMYFACRQVGLPRNHKEIAAMYETSLKIVNKGCNQFVEIMGLKFRKLKSLTAIDFLPRFCQTLQIEYPLQTLLSQSTKDFIKSGVSREVDPTNMAGGAILWLCQEKSLSITKEQIVLACGCSKVISRRVCASITTWHKSRQVVVAPIHSPSTS